MSVAARKIAPKQNEPASTMFIPLRDLFVDPVVQRSLNQGWASQIAKEFDPDHMGVVTVSERADGRYAVIDGQHRIAAVRQLFDDDTQKIECKVHRGMTTEEEAAMFVGLNNFKRPSAIQLFLKNVIAGDPEAVEINDIVRRHGFKVNGAATDGNITCVGALHSIYHGFGGDKAEPNPSLLLQTMIVVRNSWGLAKDGANGSVVEGVALLIAARAKVLDFADLSHRLSTFPGGPSGLLGRARGVAAVAGGRLTFAVADVIVDVYNKGRRLNKLEPLRR